MQKISVQARRMFDILDKMEEEKKVDPEVFKRIDLFQAAFKKSEARWSRAAHSKISFYFYYAVKNADLVLTRMKNRIEILGGRYDNQDLVKKFRELVGLLDDVLSIAHTARPKEQDALRIEDKVRQMREVAASAALLARVKKGARSTAEKSKQAPET